MFGNHFRMLNARMVKSVESVWTVLYYDINWRIGPYNANSCTD